MTHDLKPCPFCGRTTPGIIQTDSGYRVFCLADGCEAKGPIQESVREAKEAWNRRPERTCKKCEWAESDCVCRPAAPCPDCRRKDEALNKVLGIVRQALASKYMSFTEEAIREMVGTIKAALSTAAAIEKDCQHYAESEPGTKAGSCLRCLDAASDPAEVQEAGLVEGIKRAVKDLKASEEGKAKPAGLPDWDCTGEGRPCKKQNLNYCFCQPSLPSSESKRAESAGAKDEPKCECGHAWALHSEDGCLYEQGRFGDSYYSCPCDKPAESGESRPPKEAR